MIDRRAIRRTLNNVGREDRAMLRSNPSARTDAGMHNGAFQRGTPRPFTVHIGPNAINLGRSTLTPNNASSPYRWSICSDLQGCDAVDIFPQSRVRFLAVGKKPELGPFVEGAT